MTVVIYVVVTYEIAVSEVVEALGALEIAVAFEATPGVATMLGDRLAGRVMTTVLAVQAEPVTRVLGSPIGGSAEKVAVTYFVMVSVIVTSYSVEVA